MTLILNGTTGISGVDGSSGAPAFKGNDSNTGISFGTDIVTINTGGAARVTTDASGNVGIGTSSPVSFATYTALTVNGTNSDLELTRGGSRHFALITSSGATDITNVANVPLTFGTNATEKMRIEAGGNVGIGTASPASTAKLTVQGGGANGTGGTRLLSDTLYANGANYEAYGRRQDANGSGGFAPGVLLARVNTAPAAIVSNINLGRVAFGGSYDGTDANVVYGAQIAGYSSGTYSASSAATDIVFFTTPSGTAGGTTSGTANFGTERMRIDSSGSLLVGAISNPNNDKFLLNQPTLNTWSRRTNCNNYGDVIVLSAASGIAHYFVTSNGTYAGDISVSGSTTSYNSGSDYRLKENVALIKNALATVAQLKPVTYTWKADGSAGQGFIAHELQAVVPDCVVGTKDAVDKDGKPQYQGVDTSFLVATVVAALQELKAEVDSLKAQLQGAA